MALADRLPGLVGVKSAPLVLEEPFVEMAARFAAEPGAVVLLSGGDLDCARYHMLALRPWLTLTGRPGCTQLEIDGSAHQENRSPLDVLAIILEHCRLSHQRIPSPVSAGLFGYLAYDLKDDLEVLPRTSVDDLGLPTCYLSAPSLIVVHDKRAATTQLHALLRADQDPSAAEERVDAFHRQLEQPPGAAADISGGRRGQHSNFTRREYELAVQRIRAYIGAGDVYQVNLSQRFETDVAGDAYGLFQRLYTMNPAPFFAYVNAGDHQVVSTSPERFLLRNGRRVETRPIKGTRPRGATPAQDRKMKADLTSSPKDDAELSMIVDLLRNDIGKVCVGGSVVVAEHKRLEAYRNVYHLVSVVEGALAEGNDSTDLIRATFPGGSITGCPKIRAMEIIDELENRRRHVYTGAIGYVSFHDTLDLSIAIRTATVVDGRLIFSVGGGIVYDSNPADEYEETLHKGRTLMSVFEGVEQPIRAGRPAPPQAWLNGRLVPQCQASVSVDDLGLQYGFGFFETIRVDKGAARRLPSHLDRFNRSWRALFDNHPPDVTWREIIAQVIAANGLDEATAAVKILATRGTEATGTFDGTLLVTARPYVHRLEHLGADGLRLAVYPHPHLTPLADHKSLNYLYYHQAGAWARKHGADEAVILNPDGTVSETNSANLLLVSGQTVIQPRSQHVLPGVMQAAVCHWLESQGFSLVEAAVGLDDVGQADTVLLTNALMGSVPAVSLDGQPLARKGSPAPALNRDLFPKKVSSHGVR